MEWLVLTVLSMAIILSSTLYVKRNFSLPSHDIRLSIRSTYKPIERLK